jgi:hypothetical protein
VPTTRRLIQLLLLQIAGAMVAVAALEAQTVKQGDPSGVDPNAFHNPIVIETVVVSADPVCKGDDRTPEKPKASTAGKVKDKGGKVLVNFGQVHDKLVILLFPRSSTPRTW